MNTARVQQQTPDLVKQDLGIKVYQAINAVQAELSQTGIGKNQQNIQQRYSFRGIDDVLNAMAPLLARHNLVVMPHVLEREVIEKQTQRGGTLFYVTLKVQYDFVSSLDGSRHAITVYGEAMDSGDKATNKAMSAAYKYASIQVFCIPTEGDNDADRTTHQPHQPQQNNDRRGYLQDMANTVVKRVQQNDRQQAAQRPSRPPSPAQQPRQAPAWNTRSEDGPRQDEKSPVIMPHQHKQIMNALHIADISEQEFCRRGRIQGVGLLTQDRLSSSLKWLQQQARQPIH